jgi:type 1 glutamine amidotransferase
MELTQVSEHTKHQIEVAVEDGIVIKSVHGKDMKIARIVLTYTIESGQWVSWSVAVEGPRIKQSGVPGLKCDERVFHWPNRYPFWVAEAAEHYRPKQNAPLPVVPTCILDTGEEE